MLLAEKVFTEIHFAFIVARQIVEIQRGDTEHFTGTFGVRGGDKRVDTQKKPCSSKKRCNARDKV